jgi:hypothetical protein
MRQALNENPMVQLAILAVGGVLFAVLLFTTVLAGDDTAPATDTATAPGGTPAVTESSSSGATVTPSGTEPVTPVPATPEPSAGAPGTEVVPADDLVPSKGLPEDVLVALAKRQAVALLVIDPKGISDEKVKGYTERLEGRGDVAVFIVKAKKIARYSRITQGVQVSQTPALVVVSPRNVSGPELVASVSYGFRSPQSIDTAVEEALYDGKQGTTAPE